MVISNNGKYRIAQWSNLSLTPATISEKSDILRLTLSIHYPQCHQINGHKTRMLYSPSLWGSADSGPSLQPCTLYRKTHISQIPPRQIAHWSHHSALVILILFTPIKKRTAKHRAGRHESPKLHSLPMLTRQRRFSLENQSLTTWEGQGSDSHCLPLSQYRELHASRDSYLGPPPDPASGLAIPQC